MVQTFVPVSDGIYMRDDEGPGFALFYKLDDGSVGQFHLSRPEATVLVELAHMRGVKRGLKLAGAEMLTPEKFVELGGVLEIS